MIDLPALQAALTGHVSLVCVMAANNEVGTVQPVEEIASLARAAGATFFTDCVQSVLYSDINVKNSGMGMLSLSSHKFYGPKGMGVLYIKKGVPMSALINGGEQERGLRGGTSNAAGAAGFAEALSLACAEREENAFRVKALRDRFLERVLSDIPNTVLNGDREHRVPCNANISFLGVNGTALLHRLDLNGIAASAGSACASGAIEPSHVLQAMHLPPAQTESAIRFTFGKGNTLDEADYTVKILRSCVQELRAK
jgi:cysteine desulfurase